MSQCVCMCVYDAWCVVKCLARNGICVCVCVLRTNDENEREEGENLHIEKEEFASSRISLARERRSWKVTFHRTHWIDFVDHDNVDVRQLQPDERSLHGLDNVFPR